jgi:hypothetical protein
MSTAFQQRIFDLTNQYRIERGVSPLVYDSRLNIAAEKYSESMAIGDFTGHTSPSGSTPTSRANVQGFPGGVGENLGYGYRSPDEAFQGWINSPGHRDNILNPDYQSIGIGYYRLGNDTGNANWNDYWTQKFGLAAGDNSSPVDIHPKPTVNRFFDSLTGTHFYTTDLDEVNSRKADPRYSFEGEAFASTGSDTVERFYKPGSQTYFYTISPVETEVVKQMPEFQYESGQGFDASLTPLSGFDPVYRFFNTQTGVHFYTPSSFEADSVRSNLPNFVDEGIGFYVDLG